MNIRILVAGVTVVVVLACVGLAWWGVSPPTEPPSAPIQRDLFGAPVDPANHREIEPQLPPELPPVEVPPLDRPAEDGPDEPFTPPEITAYA